MTMSVVGLSIDCSDAATLAGFWSEALGRPVNPGADAEHAAIDATDPAIGAGPEKIASITDGTSNTLMFGEYATKNTPGRRTFWAYAYTSYNQSLVTFNAPWTLQADFAACAATPNPSGSNQCKRAWGSFHTGGLNFAFCDGSVHTISRSVDMVLVLPALATVSGGEVIPGGAFN